MGDNLRYDRGCGAECDIEREAFIFLVALSAMMSGRPPETVPTRTKSLFPMHQCVGDKIRKGEGNVSLYHRESRI
jgi:hypothetical protein